MSRAARLLVLSLLGCTPPERSAPAAPASSGAGQVRLPANVASAPAPSAAAPVSIGASDASAPAADAAPSDAPPALEPLSAPAEIVSVEVPGFRPAVVSLPLGATGRRPVLVALHGNFDRPEWQCEIWRGIVGARGFVLCPRGVPRGDVPKSWDRWEFGALARTEKELDAALAALAAAYPDHVDPGPVVFTGFSLGAILGTPIVKKSPARYPRVVLIEGGQSGWTRPRAKAFVAGGGARVLFACGQASCQASSRSAAKIVEAAGGGARVAYLGSVGHTYDGKVADAIAMEWDWLVEGDARWR